MRSSSEVTHLSRELLMDAAQSASKGAEKVSDLVNEAASDITFYMQKAPLFDFTLLNSG